LLQDSRQAARVGTNGELVLLEDQDRSLWDHPAIEEGTTLIERALRMGRAGPYQIQAAIAAIHARATEPQATSWVEIAVLYSILKQMVPSPIVQLNEAVAVAMAYGPARGLERLDEAMLAAALEGYHLYHAARADLLRRLGRTSEASLAYVHALSLCENDVE